MITSDNIETISISLVSFQGEIEAVKRNVENSFLKSKYADLGAVVSTIKPIMHRNGLAAIQSVEERDGRMLHVTTRVLHISGQWLESSVAVGVEKLTPQGYGIAISYGRRYGLQTALGLTQEDDDAASIDESSAKGVQKRRAKSVNNANKEWHVLLRDNQKWAIAFKALGLTLEDGDYMYAQTSDQVAGLSRADQFFAMIQEQVDNPGRYRLDKEESK